MLLVLTAVFKSPVVHTYSFHIDAVYCSDMFLIALIPS